RKDLFTDLPHLVKQAESAPLTWALAEVECRYADLTVRRCRTTEQFNRKMREAGAPPPIGALGDTELVHPDVVVVIDELADISDAEAVVELTREGRAVGFHVIAHTAIPSQRVLNSRIKGYFPARLALPVSTAEESVSILDRMGAESLGPDEGLFSAERNGAPHKIRIAAIS